MRKLSLILFVSVAFFLGCGEEKQGPPKEKIAHVYVDLLLSDETSYSKDAFQEKRDSVLKSYNLTETEYQDALKLYAEKTESWEKFFNEANSYLTAIRDSIKASRSDTAK